MPAEFHDIRFPLDIALGARGGPERRTDVVTLASGREHRNARWAHSRRRYDAGYGVKTLAALGALIAFFEERRGRLYGFRWHDRADAKSCAPAATPAATDQTIGTGDGSTREFQLTKTYGGAFAPYRREITKPVAGSVAVAVAGAERLEGADFTLDATAGIVAFTAAPAIGAAVTAGFVFDVPVRFDSDTLDIDLAAFEAGEIPHIPLIEIVP